jgi:entericidin B
MKRKMTTALTAALLLTVVACNTVEGVGEDVESGGEAISHTAK